MSSYAPVAHTATPASSLGDRMQYAKALAESGLLPRQYQRQPANLLVAIETGDMLGIAPMAAISNIHIVEGKPTMSAALMSALVRRAGHTVRVTGDDTQATAEVIRADDPSFTHRSVWTLDRAERAGLTGKGPWQHYPAAMLKARATSEVVRDAASEVFLGPIYSPEELGASVDGEGAPLQATATVDHTPTEPEPVDVAPVEDTATSSNDSNGEDTGPDGDSRTWDDIRAELVTLGDAEALRQLWQAAKADAAPAGVLHRIARDGKDISEQTAGGEQ